MPASHLENENESEIQGHHSYSPIRDDEVTLLWYSSFLDDVLVCATELQVHPSQRCFATRCNYFNVVWIGLIV